MDGSFLVGVYEVGERHAVPQRGVAVLVSIRGGIRCIELSNQMSSIHFHQSTG